MRNRYTVLRSVRGAHTREPFSGGRAELEAIPMATRPVPRVETADLTPGNLRDLARDPEVTAIAPVMPTKLITPMEGPNGAGPKSAWGVAAIRADRSAFTGNGVVVAVLDTGIDATHLAFQGVTLVQKDFSGSGDGDKNGHGTHCAGTIFGRDVGPNRIGIARGVQRALIGKVLDDQGSGQSNWIFEAMQWALDNGAKVISMSLGFDFPGLVRELVAGGWPVDLATSAALEAYRGNLRMFDSIMGLAQARIPFDGGAVVVAAAGNESHREIDPAFEIAVSLPAAAEGVISVGALAQSASGLVVPDFSNTLPQISAPGVSILSAKAGGGLRVLTGTSMAAPHVAGAAALWWHESAQAPTLTNARTIVAKLLANAKADPLGAGVDVADRGVGLVMAP